MRCIVLFTVLAAGAGAQTPDLSRPDFGREVRPILAEHCYACHGPDGAARQADLRLDQPEQLEALARSGHLLARVEHEDPDARMPPPEAKQPLTEAQRDLLRRWVAGGAPTERHWAFVAPARTSVPEASHPVDALVEEGLRGSGLSPSPEAPPALLLRRLHLDLVGLPPPPEEVDRFVEEHRADPDLAVARAVDGLLARPAFGEHWARPWLDLARYADSNGYQADQLRPSWAFRDWVVRSMNANQPFDEFTVEQLAGDLLPGSTPEQRVATGFHRAAPCNVEAGVHPEENRTLQVIDRVNTTATVWLGLTMECAQCHDHKYDPFPTEEYYGLFAYFNQSPLEVQLPSGTTDVSHDFVGPYMDLPLAEAQEAERTELKARSSELRERREALLAAEADGWIEGARAALGGDDPWQARAPLAFEVSGPSEARPLEDASTLLGGEVPDRATYTIELPLGPEPLTMLRLEALTHPGLPGTGPGRGDPERRNFVLNEVELRLDGEAVALRDPVASFEQKGWPAAGAIDGDPKTGWAIAPRFGEPHELSVALATPQTGSRLEVVLHQNYGQGRVIGRLRLSTSSSPEHLRRIPPATRSLLARGAASWSEEERKQVEGDLAKLDPGMQELEGELAELTSRLAQIRPDRTLVMQDLVEGRVTRVLERGQYLSPAEEVQAGVPAALHPQGPGARSDRLGLARWIVDPANPLTARVVVNRWWAELFGTGLVESAEDFGLQSTPPSHPELLDWLAVELVESGWDRKHLLRCIVTSRTYRQDSQVGPAQLERDPANRLLARGPRLRLAAETIRDQALAAAGLLSSEAFGPPVMPFQPEGVWRAVGRGAPTWTEARDERRYRRGLYVVWRRAAPYPSFVTFDAPDRASCTVSRPRTNTPLQALALLNDPVQLEAALALADQALSESPQEPATRIFRRVLAREPEAEELEVLLGLQEERLLGYRGAPERAEALLEGVRGAYEPGHADRERLAACFHVAHVVLNLDEAVVRR